MLGSFNCILTAGGNGTDLQYCGSVWWSVNSDLDLAIIYSFNVAASLLNTAKEGMEEKIQPQVDVRHLKPSTCRPGKLPVIRRQMQVLNLTKLGPCNLVPSVPREGSCGLGGVGS